MSHRTLGAGLAAAAASLALAAPASAQLGPLDTQYFFHCAGGDPVKVQNLSAVAPGQAFWDTTAPTRSFQSGAGCGFADAPTSGTNPVNIYDAYFSGVHTKGIEKITLELHNLVTSRARQGDSITFNVKVTKGAGTEWTALAQKDFTVKPTASSTGATEKVVVEFTGLKIKPELGRQINITVTTPTPGVPQGWVFDAAEIPANVIFTEPAPLPPATA
jgi:hypothetical protein